MKKYDAIIVLGSQPDPSTWKVPDQVYECLDTAKGLLEDNVASYILLSGKWCINYDYLPFNQPFKDCDIMADYLKRRGIPGSKLLLEKDSKDTISNLYYMHKQILQPHHMKTVLFIVAGFRVPRLQFLIKKVWGNKYRYGFHKIGSEVSFGYNEDNTSKMQTAFLEPMQDGDDSWLDDKFYDGWLYKYWGERARRKYCEDQLKEQSSKSANA